MSIERVVLILRERGHLACTSLAAAGLLFAAADARADITLSNRVATTPRHSFTLDDTGLPAQLDIRVVTNDIPLAWRTQKELPAALLRYLGRGPQLASPMRIEAVVDKATVVAKAETPAAIQKTDKGVEAVAARQASPLKGRLRLLYAEDGSLTGQITYDSAGAPLEKLDLVMELSGPVDTAIAGNPVAGGTGVTLPPSYGSLPSESGMLWRNGATPTGDGGAQKGRVSHFFLGNGDRGFTWLPHAAEGYVLGEKEPSMSVERSKDGVIVWRIALVNKEPLKGERTAGFTLLTHPSRVRSATRRREQWQPWTETVAQPALTAEARGPLAGRDVLLRADAGSVHEAFASRALLAGPAGGDALSAAATTADRFPIGLFRYLSAPHTALAAQLRPDAVALATSGASPAPDRMALGRALLHDVGVDVAGLADTVGAAGVLRALESFGMFSDDGNTEFLPYWRTTGILRYGEDFNADAKDRFAATTTDPNARVRVSAFIRPDGVVPQRGPARQTLLVIVNEGTNAVRGQLYILQPSYLFGSRNAIRISSLHSQFDFTHIPGDGDWRRTVVEGTTPSAIGKNAKLAVDKADPELDAPPLMDLESGGYVALADRGDPKVSKLLGPAYAVKEPFEVYGPIYVPARGFRLVWGAGRGEFASGINGMVVQKDTQAPMSDVPVHIFKGVVDDVSAIADVRQDPRRVATVQTGKDGCFRQELPRQELPRRQYTVMAEVAGKLYLMVQSPKYTCMMTVGKSAVQADMPLDGHLEWPSLTVREGKWMDCIIEAGPAAP